MQKKTVYIETSIVSYLTARPSSNLIGAAWQKTTIDWWDKQRHRFSLYISDIVIMEASRGNTTAAARRLEVLSNIPVLEMNESVTTLSKAFISLKAVPKKALDDSLHIAVAAIHGVDYLLTWNCKHIDNAEIKPLIRNICVANGYASPEICTPQELMGVLNNG